MKTLRIMGEPYDAEKIVKGNNYIIGYNGNVEEFKISGISDFTDFRLDNGAYYDNEETETVVDPQVAQNTADIQYISLMMGVVL